MPADFWRNAIPTIDQLRDLLAAVVLVLGAAGALYAVFMLSMASIAFGADGYHAIRARWRMKRNRRQVSRILTDAERRRQLEAIVECHPEHRNGFGKTREFSVNALRDPRR